MDSIKKKRIRTISGGIILIAIGISFITSFPAYSQYSFIFILGGITGLIIGFRYPFQEIAVKKPRPSLKESDGGKMILTAIIMIVFGLIFGPLEFYENTNFAGIGVIIIVIFCFGGLVLFTLGAIMFTCERFKET